MLTLDHIYCAKGGRPLLQDLSLQVQAGECLHLRGANGSGKTTLLRLMAGLTQADEGTVRWQGEALRRAGSDYASASLYLGHANALQESATVTENIQYQAALVQQVLVSQQIDMLLAQENLAHVAHRLVRHLSQGQKRRIALARLQWTHAKLWLLDEPLVALDQSAIERLGQRLDQHIAAGGSVVFTSHQPLPLKRPPLTLDLNL
jgi:heme exporter protein A